MKNSKGARYVGIKEKTHLTRKRYQPRRTFMRASDLRWAELLTNAKEAREGVQQCMDEGIIEKEDLSTVSDEDVFKVVRVLKKICDEEDK